MGVLAYKKGQSLAMLVKDSPVLSMKPWVESLNSLHWLIRSLGNFVVCPESHLNIVLEIPNP
jgi:hypothetical protein